MTGTFRASARPNYGEPSVVARAAGVAIVSSAFCVAAAIVVLFLASNSIAASRSASFAGTSESARATDLTQRVLRDLLSIANSRQRRLPSSGEHDDLSATATSLDETIATLSDRATGRAYEALANLRTAWSPIRSDLATLGDTKIGGGNLDGLVQRTLVFNGRLEDAVDGARTQLAADETARAEDGDAWRRLASTIALVALSILALAIAARFSDAARQWQSFAEMLERMVADLAKGSLRLDRDRREYDIVLSAAADGMFGLDRGLRVEPPHASDLGAMFGTRDVDGRSLHELLRPLVSERRLHEFDAFLAELYRADVSDDRVARDNPLVELELATGGDDGHGARYLEFGFRRIREDDAIAHVFVSIEDVSARVRKTRERALVARRSAREEAVARLVASVSHDRLAIFLAEAEFEARRMGDAIRPEDMALATRGYVEILRERLGSLLVATGRLKKLAHGVGFFYLFDLANVFERRIVDVRRASYVDGDEFLAIVVTQAELREELEEVKRCRQRAEALAS